MSTTCLLYESTEVPSDGSLIENENLRSPYSVHRSQYVTTSYLRFMWFSLRDSLKELGWGRLMVITKRNSTSIFFVMVCGTYTFSLIYLYYVCLLQMKERGLGNRGEDLRGEKQVPNLHPNSITTYLVKPRQEKQSEQIVMSNLINVLTMTKIRT